MGLSKAFLSVYRNVSTSGRFVVLKTAGYLRLRQEQTNINRLPLPFKNTNIKFEIAGNYQQCHNVIQSDDIDRKLKMNNTK